MKTANKCFNAEFLPVALWLLPVLAINIGFVFISGIDVKWQKEEYKKAADASAEALFAASDFDRQASKHAGRFELKLIESLKLYSSKAISKKVLNSQINAFVKNEFAPPFAETKVFVFELSPSLKRCETIFKRKTDSIGEAAYRKAFEFLVKKAEGIKTAQERSGMIKRLFGEELASGELLASEEFRSRIAYVSHLSSSYCLIWNYKKYENKSFYGFFVLVKAGEGASDCGRLLALNDLNNSTQKNTYGAFIPLFKNVGKAVIPSKLNKSALFKSWLKKQKRALLSGDKPKSLNDPNDPDEIKSTLKILSEEQPKPERLGAYEVYSYIGKGASHKAVVLKKAFEAQNPFQQLKAFNVCFGFIFVLLMLRGALFGEWPKLRLTARFLTVYLLSATLPVVMLVMALSGYLLQYRRANEFALVNNLKTAISQFDLRKDQIQEEYRNAFNEVISNEKFVKALENKALGTAKQLVIDLFAEKKLPLLGFKIIDTKNSRGENGKDCPEAVYHGGKNPQESEPTLNTLSRPIAKMLKAKRENKKVEEIEFEPPNATEAVAEQAYAQMVKDPIEVEVDRHINEVVTHQSATRSISHIHNRINVKGRPKYALLLLWNNQSLDEITYKAAFNRLRLINPSIDFAAFKKEPAGLAPFPKSFNDRHNKGLLRISKDLAEQAFFRNTQASSKPDKNYSMLACVSQKFMNTVFVAGSNHDLINNEINKRIWLIIIVIASSILAVILCTAYSAKQILEPVILLKNAIDRVAEGNLNTRLISGRADEIGSLCKEFSIMTKGLQERQRLATLISDQALNAIAASEKANEIAQKSFDGTALVSDIRNFTVMCEKQNPNEVTRLLNRHYEAMTAIISSYGGQIYKFIGDAIEAVFEESDKFTKPAAVRAFEAGCIMLLKLREINEAREKKGLFTYKSGVGLAAGKMHSGPVGSLESRVDYAILGTPIEQAANLEGVSKLHSELPIIADKNVCKMLKKAKITLEPFAAADNTECYFLRDSSVLEQIKASFSEKSAEKDKTIYNAKAESEAFEILKPSLKHSIFYFALSVVLVLFIAAGVIYVKHLYSSALYKQTKEALSEANHKTAKLLLADSAPEHAFETRCLRLVEELELKIAKDDSFIKNNLKSYLESKTGNLQDGVKTANCAAFFDFSLNPIFVKGFEQETLDKLLKDFKTSNENLKIYLTNTRQNANGGKEYVFCAHVLKNSSKSGGKIFVPAHNTLELGVLLLSAPCKELEENLQYQINAFSSELLGIAAITGGNKKFASEHFAPQSLDKFNYTGKSPPDKLINKYLITSDLKLGLKPVQILTSQRLKMPNEALTPHEKLAYAILAALFLLLSALINFKTTIIDRYASARVFLAMPAALVIPAVFMALIFAQFIKEDYTAKVNSAKSNLNAFLDNFESKKNVSDCLMWNFAARYLKNEGLKVIASASSRAEQELLSTNAPKKRCLSRANSKYLNDTIKAWVKQAEKSRRKDVYNFELYEIDIFDKNFEYTAQAKGRSDDFFDFTRAFVRSLAQNKYPEAFTRVDLKNDVSLKDVIINEAGLNTIKAIYGNETYLKGVSAADMPIRIFSVRGMFAYRLVFLSEGQNPFARASDTKNFKPKWAVYFYVWHEYNDFLRRIAKKYSSKERPLLAVELGKEFVPEGLKYGFEIKNLIARAAYSKLPAFEQIKNGTENIFLQTKFSESRYDSILIGAASDKEIRQKQRVLTGYFTAALAALLLLLFILAKVLANDITAPLACLEAGFKHVYNGEYEFRINLKRSDELGELCRSFDVMMRGLAEKETMGKMISKKAKSFAADKTLNSVVEQYVFMYAGIPDFNSLAEAYAQIEEAFNNLRRHITAVSGIIIKRHGDIDKIIEHKILAVFNVGNNPANAVKEACEAVKEIMRAEASGLLPYPVSIGINIGRVIAGFLGVGAKRDYTVIGDAVNVAARIEGIAQKLERCRCLISNDVFELLTDKSAAQPFKKVLLKGKSHPMQLYNLKPITPSSKNIIGLN